MEWSQKRKILYATLFATAFLLLVSYVAYLLFHKEPTCFDKKQNGTETGVDCGGSCALVCTAEVKPLRTVWAKTFSLNGEVYDMGAYVENVNINAGIQRARYVLRAIGADGGVLAEKNGVVEIAPSSRTLLFETGAVFSGQADRVEVVFNPEDLVVWTRANNMPPSIVAKNQDLKNVDTKPRFDAVLVNTDPVNAVSGLTVGAIIYDALRHPVAVSKTYVDYISPNGEQEIFFTWPSRFTKRPRGGMCTSPVDTMLVFDRSGSMDVGHKTPPQPLETAKNAATTYVEAADIVDKVGLVSFATTVSSPVDHELSLEHEGVREAVVSIGIGKDGIQNTNLGDAIKIAAEELRSVRGTKDAKKVIVVLTDGVANFPLDPANPKNTAYADEYAAGIAKNAQNAGIRIYAIGLGNSINEAFLRDRIAIDPSRYFNAPTAQDLKGVYKKISETVCQPENFITDIVVTPRAVFAE